MSRGQIALRVLRELKVLIETECPAKPLAPHKALRPDPGPLNHVFHEHTPLWRFEHPFYAQPYADPGHKPLFQTLAPDATLDEVLDATPFVVLLGAADTEIFRRCLARPGVFLLIFEPDPGRLEAFASTVPALLLARCALILHGDPLTFMPPLSHILPQEMFDLGFPVFYALPGFDQGLAAAGLQPLEDFVRLLELLFYRYRLYPLSGQANRRNLPIRPLHTGPLYDQQLHAYANLIHYATRPDISALCNAFCGETAVLVAAGPDLAERLDVLKRLRESCLIIAVNNALKPMLAAGVRPHFVVANDTSAHTGLSWQGLPKLTDVILVGHALTDLGAEVFDHIYLFDSYLPELFGDRPNLQLHASVITTGFSLARHMGCTRCILAGVQLCSKDPWRLAYAPGSIHEGDGSPAERPLTGAYPQLVPAANRSGRTRYTSLNFLDASLWLLDEIRSATIPCVNLSQDGLVYGPGIEHDEAPEIPPTGQLAKRLAVLTGRRQAPMCIEPALDLARHDVVFWDSVAGQAAQVEALAGEDFLVAAQATLTQYDADGMSYLVQGFDAFDNVRLHALVFEGKNHADIEAGLRYYLDHIRRMAKSFVLLLTEQINVLAPWA